MNRLRPATVGLKEGSSIGFAGSSDNLRERTLTFIDAVKFLVHKDEKGLNTLISQLFHLFFQFPQLPDYIG